MRLEEIFRRLELEKSDSLIRLSDLDWREKVEFPSRVSRLIETNDTLKKIKAFFCFDNKPLILFFEDIEIDDDFHKAVWNFNESPIVIIADKDKVEIFNGFALDENEKLLIRLGGESILNDFNYFELVTGKTWEKYSNDLKYKNRVDYKLLENIEATQKILCNDYEIEREIANALLGKIIFIRYLIDREVILKYNGVRKSWTNDELCTLLQNGDQTWTFFEYLSNKENGFNGDLFIISKNEFDNIPTDAFSLIIRLLKSEEISSGQQSLFDLYDFSILPIEFISNVYEKFIGKENQANEGAYYTPTFLVDYIISQTVSLKLEAENKNYNCKTLDPACGSGIFLVETLRKIIEKYIKVNDVKKTDTDEFREKLRELTVNNIYGIDSDKSAIQVAIFSIYLTLLDYQKPAEIEKFKFPTLLNTNFVHADAFDLENAVLKEFESQNHVFDCVIGNPPWNRGKVIYDNQGKRVVFPFEKYISEKSKLDKECVIGNKEIAQAFIIRSKDFCSEETNCALIVTSKTLYNIQSADFRKYFLKTFLVNQVFELAPVRREVFDKSNDKAIAPACILFYKLANEQDTDKNIVKHIALKPSRFFSLFKIFTLTRNDIKRVQQSKLKDYDWLWKVLVYGSYLDFNLIKRLKSEYISISDYLRDKSLVKQGLKRVDGDKKINVTELINWEFLDLRKEIEQFYINPKHQKWTNEEVGYIYREDGEICLTPFTPPVLLIKETVNTSLESISAVSKQRLLFTDKITSVKLLEDENFEIYQLISGQINSTLFAYYILHFSSTAGIMIEQQINDVERFSFPFCYSEELINKVSKIEGLTIKQKNLNDFDADKQKYQLIIEANKNKLNNIISNIYSLNEKERDLVSYAEKVSIPIIMKHKGYQCLLEPIEKSNIELVLKEYIQIFLDRFSSSLNQNGKQFVVEVWHTNQIIGMFFKVIDEIKCQQEVTIIDKQQTNTIIPFLLKISNSEVTDKLFVQNDIRGFEKDYFYIFKPNEKRLWHKAIGYIDANEFADAILKAGRDNV